MELYIGHSRVQSLAQQNMLLQRGSCIGGIGPGIDETFESRLALL